MRQLLYLSLFLSFSSFAQDPYLELDESFRGLGEVFLITSGDVTSVARSREAGIGPCIEQAEQREDYEIDLGLTPQEQPESKWRFSVMTTMGGPRAGLAKHYADKNERYFEMASEIDGFIAQEFSSHDDRVGAIKSLCNGKNEMDRIAMASTLGTRLSSIYDYDRINGGPNSRQVITPANQWEALRARANGENATSGVCRDASITVSQFLLACGFKNDQVSIEGYRTAGGGHQVTTVRTSDGEAYTINWSELYASDESAHASAAPNPNLVNAGIFYSVYDPETGQIVERRRTELGEVLRAVAGGSVDDPNHLPQLLKLEAGYGVISANVFRTQTERGDVASGIAAYVQQDNLFGIMDISAGVAFAQNTRDVATSAGSESVLGQNILYGQIEGRFLIPELSLIDREEQTLSLLPTAVITTEGFYSSNSLDGNESQGNGDANSEFTAGMTALYHNGGFGAFVGSEVDMNIIDRRFNNQRGTPGENGSNGGVFSFANSYNIHGGVSFDSENFTTSATAEHTIMRSGTRTSLGATLMDHGRSSSYSAVYSLYDRNYGVREDFVVIRAERDFVIERAGTLNIGGQVQVPLADDFNQTTVGLSLRFVPSIRRR